MTLSTATAHEAWDHIWRTDAGRTEWLVPEQDVIDIATEHYRAIELAAAASGPANALDLGCGIGRHALALSSIGYRTVAIDASEGALIELKKTASKSDVSVQGIQAPMTNIPVPNASQDYLVAWNVIYHGDPDVVARTVSEIQRVLRPGGIYQGTMLTKRNKHFGVGEEIAPDTWVDTDPPASDIDAGADKNHPHFYCDASGLCQIFAGFEVISLTRNDQGRPGHWHWHVVLERH